jgi:hypothetical protein
VGVDLGVAVARLAEDEGRMVRPGARARREEIREDLLAEKIVT